jgi:adenine deaminase
MKNLITLLSIITIMTACSNSKTEKAGLVIINGKVLTIDSDNPVAEAIAIEGEKIIAVGTTRKISAFIVTLTAAGRPAADGGIHRNL